MSCDPVLAAMLARPWNNNDRPRMCYGEYLPTHQAIRFDLKSAQALDVEQQ